MSATQETTEEVQELRSQVAELRQELKEVRSPRISVAREPLTYEARLVRDKSSPRGFRAVSTRENFSYVHDLALYRTDYAARERMNRHEMEMRTIRETQSQNYAPDIEYEQRVVNWTAGTGGYFAPPLWIVEYFAHQPTPERVLAELAPKFELPEGIQSVNLPAWTTGGDVNVQGVGSAVVSSSTVDTAISSAVTTIAGNYDVPLQMLEQSPQGAHLDWVAFTAMESRYGGVLELQLITGTGAAIPQGSGNNQLLGILNNTAIPVANQITYTDSTPTVAEMIQTSGQGGPLPQAIAAVGNARKLSPEVWMMRTSRAAWIASGEINFPLALSNQEGPGHFALLAYDVKPSNSIPINLGAAANQDTIIVCRPSDWLVLESERKTEVMVDGLSGALMARLQMRRYVAALLRYPSSVAYLSGTGMAVPTNF